MPETEAGRSHHAGDFWLPSPSRCPHLLHVGKHACTAGLECAVSGRSDCRELAAATLERRQTSLLSWTLFFSRSLKGLWSGDMCGTAPCTGAEQVRRGGEPRPALLTQGPFNSPPRIALGRAAPTSLAGCRESECEKVSQAEEKEKKKASSPQAKYLFSSSSSLSFL